jgi:hypothetical protein
MLLRLFSVLADLKDCTVNSSFVMMVFLPLRSRQQMAQFSYNIR